MSYIEDLYHTSEQLFSSFDFGTIQIGKMLKPDKWQSTFDSDGKIFGFRKVLKLIILGVCQMCFYSRFSSSI